MKKYFNDLKNSVDKCYSVSIEARKLGFDPVDVVESPLALNMAERSVNLIKTIYPKLPVSKIVERILELEDKFGKLDVRVSFEIAFEISKGSFGKFKNELERIDVGARIAFAYMTLGVVASPIEGYTGLTTKKTKEGKDYFVVGFSGPIRSAGTTTVCLFLILIDYLRESFGYAKYDITKEEIGRYIQENKDFHERVANLQYFPTEKEMEFLARNLSVQIDGAPTEKIEVSDFKDLERVSTNRIRGGVCLVFSEGLAQKIGKAWGRLKGYNENLNYHGFRWVDEYLAIHKEKEKRNDSITYIENLVAGRPVYGHPGKSGGFRFRYGRGRTSGFSAASIHPATMGITGGFLSNGTQLKIEKPTKGCILTSCDTIEGPIVKLKNGSVKKITEYQEAFDLYEKGEVEEIIYLGDILFSVGDMIDRNVDLIKPGYVSEWWLAELGKKVGNVDFELAVKLSKEIGVPLHPDFIFYWTQISKEGFFNLIKWLNGSIWRSGKLILNWGKNTRDGFSLGKRTLELLGVEHEVYMDNIIIGKDARALLFNIGKSDFYNGEVLNFKVKNKEDGGILDIVNELCDCEIKDKAGTFIGARMGRPEKAKLRKLAGSPNVLFPIGNSGGKLKNVQIALEKDFVKAVFPMFRCVCGNEGVFEKCDVCGKKSKRMFFCRDCNKVIDERCPIHGEVDKKWLRKIDFRKCIDSSVNRLRPEVPNDFSSVKGVLNLNSDGGVPENLAKGILRSKFGLSVNKDGTIRYDATEIPLTHFKPKEIGTDIKKLRALGYLKDIKGLDLVNENQILELYPHDVVLPKCSVLGENSADKVFLKIADFIDEELERFYKMDRFYNFKDSSNLVGVNIVCIAPHNCAGVIGRVIGFGNMQGLLASPYMHAAMRRDCDGDEASVMLLMDVLLNFSKEFLPSHRGGTQDAPLVLNIKISAGEVDDQILFFESCGNYPLSLYESAEMGFHSSIIRPDIELIGDKLKAGRDEFVGNGFSHNTSDFNLGNNNGIYKSLPTMKNKVAAQMALAKKLRGVDENDVARLVLERHFIRDIRGNLRKFMKQEFRCLGCGEKFRRPPLVGVCSKCGGKLIFTISEGSVRKYLEPALELSREYDISNYTRESMELIKDDIESIFGKEDEQKKLD